MGKATPHRRRALEAKSEQRPRPVYNLCIIMQDLCIFCIFMQELCKNPLVRACEIFHKAIKILYITRLFQVLTRVFSKADTNLRPCLARDLGLYSAI